MFMARLSLTVLFSALLALLPGGSRAVTPVFAAPQACPVPRITTGGTVRTISVGGRPDLLAVDQRSGHVVVASNRSSSCAPAITMLDAKTGRVLRRLQVGHIFQALTTDARAGKILAVDSGDASTKWAGRLISLDAGTGRVVHVTATGPESSAVAIDESTWRAFVINAGVPGPPYAGRSLSVVAITRGTVLRTVPLGTNAGPTVLAVDGRAHRVFVDTQTGTLMLDSHDGHTIATIGRAGRALAVDSRTSRLFIFNQQVCGDNNYLPPDQAEVTTVNSRTGAVLGTVHGPCAQHVGGAYQLLVDEPAGLILVPQSMDGGWGALALDAHSGAIVRDLTRVGSEPSTLPVGTVDGKSGSVYFAAPVFVPGNPSSFQSVVRRLEPTSWTISTALEIPVNPTALAVAGSAGRVFLASADSGTVADFSTAFRPRSGS
jgi:hypothetical protein